MNIRITFACIADTGTKLVDEYDIPVQSVLLGKQTNYLRMTTESFIGQLFDEGFEERVISVVAHDAKIDELRAKRAAIDAELAQLKSHT